MRRLITEDANGEDKEAENEPVDLEWLYKPDFAEMVDMWLSRASDSVNYLH